MSPRAQADGLAAEVFRRRHHAEGSILLEPALSPASVDAAARDLGRALRAQGGEAAAVQDSRPLHVLRDRVVAATHWRGELTAANVERWLPIVEASLARVGSAMTRGRIESTDDPPWVVTVEGGRWHLTEGPRAGAPGSLAIEPPLGELALYGIWIGLDDALFEVGEHGDYPAPDQRPPEPFSVERERVWVAGEEPALAVENVRWWLPVLVTLLAEAGSALADGVVECRPASTGRGWRLVVEDGAWTIHELPVGPTAPGGAG